MKQIINGKTYNTATATEIAEWDNGLHYGDFGWCEETLYKTTKGAFFLLGRGGAASLYCEYIGNNGRVGGKRLIALTEREALEWVSDRRIDPDLILEHINVEEA
jgi:hypothetical protein